MTRDDGWDDGEIDAFVMGADEVEVRKTANAGLNPIRVTSAPSDTPPIAPEGDSVRLVGDLPPSATPRGYGSAFKLAQDRLVGRAMEEAA